MIISVGHVGSPSVTCRRSDGSVYTYRLQGGRIFAGCHQWGSFAEAYAYYDTRIWCSAPGCAKCAAMKAECIEALNKLEEMARENSLPLTL